MKRKLILGSLLALTTIAVDAQPWILGGSGIYNNGSNNVGINTTSPTYNLDIEASSPSNGIRIVRKTIGAAGITLDNQTTGGKNWSIFSLGSGDAAGAGNFSIFHNVTPSSGSHRFFIDGTSGNVGIGTTNPSNILSLQSATSNDGIYITQTSTGASAVHLDNTTTSGRHWAIFSAGSGNTQGSGNFSIFDYNSGSDRLFIKGTSGNVGIGTTNTDWIKLNVVNKDPIIPNGNGANGSRWGVKGVIEPQEAMISHGIHEFDIGVEGGAYTVFQAQGIMYGVVGKASNGLNNHGGYFEANLGNQNYTGAANFGIRAKATGNWNSYGVYAEASGAFANQFAVWSNGSSYSTAGWLSSDRKLKKDIQPLNGAIEKIMKLNPSTYSFKTDEFKSMNLPEGKQIGLISQELETVFPELVLQINKLVIPDENGDQVEKNPDFKAVNYTALIPVLIKGIQEQQAQIEKQSEDNTELKKLVQNQQNQIDELLNKANSTTGLENHNGTTGFQMSQNEPNPFTHETVVKYTLPTSISNAFMAVYDLTGKQITTFPINERGNSSVVLTSDKLSAGIYIYSIVADGNVIDSKRMIVAEK